MKYCSHCGAELIDEAVVCTKCGCSVDSTIDIDTNKLKGVLLGIILTLIFNIVGYIICYLLGDEDCKKGSSLIMIIYIIIGIISIICFGIRLYLLLLIV